MVGFASRRPLLFSVLAILAYLGGMSALAALLEGSGLSRLGVACLAQFAACVYVAGLLTRFGWWRVCGFAQRVTGRTLLVFSPWLLLPVAMLADCDRGTTGPGRPAVYLFWALMVGFAEEGLLRGVVLRALLPRGAVRAAVLSSLLFGLAHLTNMLGGRDAVATLVQVAYATFIGIGFAGPFLRTGAIWPAVVLHGLIDFADYASRGFTPANAAAEATLRQALPALAITGAYAAYGWWLLRRRPPSPRPG